MTIVEKIADALWRHEVADLRAAKGVRDTMVFSEQSETLKAKWLGFARAALAAQQDGATIGEFGGVKFVADKLIPNDVIEFHHPDGRIDRFRRVEQAGE